MRQLWEGTVEKGDRERERERERERKRVTGICREAGKSHA